MRDVACGDGPDGFIASGFLGGVSAFGGLVIFTGERRAVHAWIVGLLTEYSGHFQLVSPTPPEPRWVLLRIRVLALAPVAK